MVLVCYSLEDRIKYTYQGKQYVYKGSKGQKKTTICPYLITQDICRKILKVKLYPSRWVSQDENGHIEDHWHRLRCWTECPWA